VLHFWKYQPMHIQSYRKDKHISSSTKYGVNIDPIPINTSNIHTVYQQQIFLQQHVNNITEQLFKQLSEVQKQHYY
jgi:hypothetical protein